MQIYPNPVDDHIACVLRGDGHGQVTLTLSDMKGSVVYSNMVYDNASINIPVAGLPAGEYLLNAMSGNGVSDIHKVQVLH